MKLEYIKANGVYYFPQEAGEQDPNKIPGCFRPVCYIKKLWFGRWQIDQNNDNRSQWNNQVPNEKIILYPAGIEEIVWQKNNDQF